MFSRDDNSNFKLPDGGTIFSIFIGIEPTTKKASILSIINSPIAS